MSYTHALSKREKSLAIVGVALLLVLLVVGYAKATVGQAAALVAQEATTPATTPATPAEPVKESDVDNQQRQIKDQNNWLKNYQSELKDIKRQAKTLDTSAVDGPNGLFTQFSNCINQAGVGTQDFWNNIRDCQSMQGDIDAQFNDVLRPARDCANSKSNIDKRKTEKKSNLDSQIKNILRNDKTADVSVLTVIIDQINALFVKADALTCTRETSDALNDIAREFDGLFQDFDNSSNEVNQAANEGRQLQDNIRDYEKDKKKRCEKDKARELRNFEKEVAKSVKAGDSDAQAAYNSVKEIYDQMCVEKLAEMQKALESKDVDTYNEARSAYDELDRTFWDTMNESRQGVQEKRQKAEQLKNVTRDLKQKTKDLKRMKTALKRAETSFNKVASKYLDKGERQQAKKELQAYIAKANELVTSMNAGLMAADQAVKDGDVDTLDEYWSDQQDLDDMRGQFDELQRSAQFIPELIKQLANVEKELSSKKLARERNSLPEELKPQFDELVSNINQSASNAWSVLVSDPDAAAEELQSIQMANQDWNETRNAWYEENQGEEEEPRATLPYFK